MFPFWSRSTEQALIALQRAKQQELAEHDAAVARIVQQAHEGDENSNLAVLPSWDVRPKPQTADSFSLLALLAADPASGLEEIKPGVYQSRKNATDWDR